MNAPLTKTRVVVLACAIAAFVLLAVLWNQVQWRANFSKWSPSGVFQMVLGQNPPSGVSGIQVSGRQYVIKRWVWMRFHATRPAMKSLTALGSPLDPAETTSLLHERGTPNHRYDEVDRQKVGWDDVERLAHPLAYQFDNLKSVPWQWQGIIVIDYPNQTVYVQAHGD